MKRVLAALAAFSAMATIALAEDAPPPIRDFDLPTVEQLGQHMYRQDQLAWKATDLLLAKVSRSALRDSKGRGWIVNEGQGRDVVRFVREGDHGLEAAYDITFVPGAEPVVSEPQDRTLNADELAQYKARMLAGQNFDFRCTPTQPNAIAFREPQSANWLVWVMTATTDPDLTVIGGHIRFTITPDGSAIVAKDKLSKGCVIFPKPKSHGDEQLVGQATTHIVSPRPVETHVFANLTYHLPLYVGTNDGATWKVDSGRVNWVDEGVGGADGSMARHMAGMNEICSPIFAFVDPNEKGFTLGRTIQVIEQLENGDTLAVDLPAGKKLSAVACVRADIVPSPNDYKLILKGVHLFLMDREKGDASRHVELILRDGKLDVKFEKGPAFDDALIARIKQRLAQMQVAYDKAKAK